MLEKCEFKSSARWDYGQEKVHKDREKDILKTIAGFLNADGGRLFIGVGDNGSILGLEKDFATLRSPNRDRYELFLSNLISDKIGIEFHSFISIRFTQIEGRDICIMEVEFSSKKEAWVIDGDNRRFFVRTQNSTRELNSQKAHEYINSHWPKG